METLTIQSDQAELPRKVEVYVKEVQKSRKRTRNKFAFIQILLLVIMIFGKSAWLAPYIQFYFSLILLSILILIVPELPRVRSLFKSAIPALSENEIGCLFAIREKHVIGTLVDFAFTYGTAQLSPNQNALLENRLLSITEDDIDLLSQQQKSALVRLVDTGNKRLNLASLGALKQIGERQQLHALKKWRLNQVIFDVEPEIKQAYNDCITAIEARAASSHSDSQLLRPSFPTDEADTYLRPVTQKIDEDADTLLRTEIKGKDKEVP